MVWYNTQKTQNSNTAHFHSNKSLYFKTLPIKYLDFFVKVFYYIGVVNGVSTMNTWSQLLRDKRVWLGPLEKSLGFKSFVDETVPEIIEEHHADIATFELWIQIQFKIAAALADISTGEHNKNIAQSLAGHANKDMFLAVRNTTEEGYALQMRGLFYEEYEALKAGELTIGELYRRNPVAFFGPLLRKNDRITH
jgi:hypothetical protein